jgi:hypothetical protein
MMGASGWARHHILGALQRIQNKKGSRLNVDNDEQRLPVDRKQGLWPG